MSITEEDIRKQLSQTILPEDDVVVVYSGLWMFGSLLGLAIKDIPDVLLNIFLDFLGHERTLLLPTYSYAYTSSRVYDLKRSRAESGVLPAHALSRKDFTRTMSPLNSYAVSGSRTDEILAVDDRTLWGDGSLMGWLDRVGARICVLGEPWHMACTHFHRAEERLRVPYRYFKQFPGKMYDDGKYVKDVSPIMYVRPLNVEMDRDYTRVAPSMREKNFILSSNDEDFPLESALAPDIVTSCEELLRANPLEYVGNPDDITEWIERGKMQEMDSMKPDERVEI